MASSRALLLHPATVDLRPPRQSPSRSRLKPFLFRCSAPAPVPSNPPSPQESQLALQRRSVSAALILLHCSVFPPSSAFAGGLFDKYLKRKKLEPLETYVPAVLLSQLQFKDLEKRLDSEKPDYDISRSLLRSGPAGSLRVNIRAVAQYASDNGSGKPANDAVDECLRALEDLDSLLLHALRNDPTATANTMRSKISVAINALDSLLKTVPASVLDRGKVIADAYRLPDDSEETSQPEEFDKDLKELEQIL